VIHPPKALALTFCPAVESVITFRAMKAQEIYTTEKSYVAGLTEVVEVRSVFNGPASLYSMQASRNHFLAFETDQKKSSLISFRDFETAHFPLPLILLSPNRVLCLSIMD
jgi:hypothetical protein